mgnify:CR=1 FL=1
MTQRIKNMTEGSPLSLIVSFALPLMVGNIFQQLYTVVDTMVVGKALGVDALAALGATDWLYWMVLGVVQGVTQGFAILMAREFGAQRYADLRRVTGISVSLAAICAVVFLIASQLAARPVLRLLQTPAEIMDQALLYLRIMFLGIPIIMAYNLLACTLRSLGDGRTPLSAMVLAALSNIALDLLFVLVFRWGIAGAAAATLIAQFLSCVFCFLRLRRIDFMALQQEHFRVETRTAARLMSLGLPMAMQNMMIAIGGMIIQSVVNGFGVAFLAGFTATNKLYGVLEIAATSYGYAMITYVGQNLGAEEYGRVKKGVTFGILCSCGMAAVIGLLSWFFAPQLIGFFSETQEAINFGTRHMQTICLFYSLLAFSHCMAGIMRGAGKATVPMFTMLACWCLLRTAYISVAIRQVNELTTVSWAYPITWTCSAVVFLIYFLAADWLHNFDRNEKSA